MWSRQSASAKLRRTKFSSEGLGCNSAKFCTSENFPLYGIIHIAETMATSAFSCLVTVKHTSSSRAGDASDSSSSDDVRPLSASGFFFRSLVVSSASWLGSLLDIGLDSSGSTTWSWKVHPHPEFVILYQVLILHIYRVCLWELTVHAIFMHPPPPGAPPPPSPNHLIP